MSNPFVSIRMATPADAHLPAFDYTKLSAINTCPRWGILRYSMHRTMERHGRVMALDAGKAMHQAFSAVRLFQLGYTQGRMDHYEHHGRRLFGDDRWSHLRSVAAAASGDALTRLRAFACECLDTAGYIEDPDDKRRRYVQLEESLLYYVQRWDLTRYPVWVRQHDDPTSDVGIEIPFAIVVEWEGNAIRYTGRIDGIHHSAALHSDHASHGSRRAADYSASPLLIGENKTASRLNDAWRMSFDVNHQPTGYMVAATTFVHQSDVADDDLGVAPDFINRALIHGLSIPIPKRMDEGYATEDVRRYPHQFDQWINWLVTTVEMHDRYVDDVVNAPLYTHSCNRYFRPCMFIPWCNSSPEEQVDTINEMKHDEWSPLEEESKNSD